MGIAVGFLLVILIVITAPSVFAKQHTVDWSLGSDFSSLTTQSLVAGDTLVFTYDGSHSVEVVTKSDYKKCVSNNALETHSGGKTSITLKEGPMYFICGTMGHCQEGMKLQINVKASGSGRGPSPTSTASTSGSGSTPSSSSGPSTNGPAVGPLSSRHLMVFGTPLALGTLFALMG